jgi:hypothetical protein
VSITKETDPTLISKFSIASSFSFVFWIDASSIGTIIQGLKGVYNLPATWSSGLDGSPELALHWIGSLKENYMIVFDNANVLSPAELEAYFPPGRGGNILITSCNSAMRNLTSPENSLKVTWMEEDDAVELLLKASCVGLALLWLQAEASRIVKVLSCVPLAINQAGAYIASGATSIGGYLAKYFEHQKTLLSHSGFTGASEYNRAVYETWELSYKEIQERAKSDDSHKANAANSAMLLLELFSFFHHEEITEKIFSYAALEKDQKISNAELLLILNQRLLPLNEAGTWDNSHFKEGIQVLLSFSLIKKASSDGVYAMHPLVHAWGRDRLTLNERKKYSLMAYLTLSSSLRKDESQPYEFQRILVTHVRATIEFSKSESGQNIVGYLDDAYVKFGNLLWKQGYSKEAETLQIKVLETRNRILGVEHPDTSRAMANLAATYESLGKYMDAEKLRAQVLDSKMKIPRPEYPDAMGNDTTTIFLQDTVADQLQVQVLDGGKEVIETDITGAMTNATPKGKQLVLVAKTALKHLQQCEAEIKTTLSLLGISEMDYILLAGFNESVMHSGIGYLEEIHVILKSEFPSDSDLLSSLGRIFSPFPGVIFTTSPPYTFQTPVFNSEEKAREWDEVVFTQAHTYTTLQMGHTMKEMELMSATICSNEGKVPSGSGSGGGGDGNEKKQRENIPPGKKKLDSNSQKGSEKDSEGDDDDSEGYDSDNPDSKGSSGADLPEISFTIQTEIYPEVEALAGSDSSKFLQALQLEGSITIQVGYSSKVIHKKQLIFFRQNLNN